MLTEKPTPLKFKNGRGYKKYPKPTKQILEAIPITSVHASGSVIFQTDEFTSMCPITSQPDWATDIKIEFLLKWQTLETKSLKLYLHAFRNYQGFAESINLKILDDIYDTIEPKWISVSMKWKARGGISITTYFERGSKTEE